MTEDNVHRLTFVGEIDCSGAEMMGRLAEDPDTTIITMDEAGVRAWFAATGRSEAEADFLISCLPD